MPKVYAGYHSGLNHGVCCGLRNWIVHFYGFKRFYGELEAFLLAKRQE